MRSNPLPTSEAVQVTKTLRVVTHPGIGAFSVTVGGLVSTLKVRVAVVE